MSEPANPHAPSKVTVSGTRALAFYESGNRWVPVGRPGYGHCEEMV
jgi:hypothetical protein